MSCEVATPPLAFTASGSPLTVPVPDSFVKSISPE